MIPPPPTGTGGTGTTSTGTTGSNPITPFQPDLPGSPTTGTGTTPPTPPTPPGNGGWPYGDLPTTDGQDGTTSGNRIGGSGGVGVGGTGGTGGTGVGGTGQGGAGGASSSSIVFDPTIASNFNFQFDLPATDGQNRTPWNTDTTGQLAGFQLDPEVMRPIPDTFNPNQGAWTGGANPGAVVRQIDPNASMRGTEILPGENPRVSATAGMVDEFANRLPGQSLGDFRSISPTDASTARATGLLDTAESAVGDANLAARGEIAGTDVSGVLGALSAAQTNASRATPPSYQADVARGIGTNALASMQGPDRGDIAARTLALLESESAPGYQRELQDVGRRAAALGRLGAGMTTSELGDVQTRRDRYLSDARERLSLDAADKSLADRANIANTAFGASGTLTSQDLGRAGFGLDQAGVQTGIARQLENTLRNSRGEAVDERTYQTSTDAERAQLALARAGAYSGLSGDVFGQGSALRAEDRGERSAEVGQTAAQLGLDRDAMTMLAGLEGQQRDIDTGVRSELRGERGFQEGLNQTAIDRAVEQLMLEDSLLNSGFNREAARLGMMQAAGYGYDPTQALLRGAGGYY